MAENSSLLNTLSSIRANLKISQEELANRLGVSFATVNRWENGKSKPQRIQQKLIEELATKVSEAESIDENETSSALPARNSKKRRGLSKSEVLSTKSMEQMLWDAACSIRGEKDAPKFKDYILPLLFLKRLSDVFDDEIERLAETYGDKESALQILEAEVQAGNDANSRIVRFYIPPESRWEVLSGRKNFDWPAKLKPKTLGEQITTTIRQVVKFNPSLAGVIDIVDFNETRNGEREISDQALKGIIEAFSDPRYRLGLHNVEPDFLGRCYEYLLRKFAEGQGQSAGEFFTPTEVGLLMAEILRPQQGEECYDYACGSFGLLIKLQIICRRLNPLAKVPLKLYGQELTGSTFAIACMNRIIHDMEGDVQRGDSMRNPKFREGDKLKKFDIVIANPMWNQPFDISIYENDSFGRFAENGGSTTGKGDWAWLQHTLSAMKDNGRAAVVLDTGAVTRGSGSKNEDKERAVRKWFVDNDLIDGVILMPDNLFYNTTAAGVILILRKNKSKDRRGKIVLLNASQEFKKGSPKNYLTDDGIKKITEAYLKGQDLDGFVKVISKEEAEKNDYNLAPSKYLNITSEVEIKDISMLVNDIEILQTEADNLFKKIKPLVLRIS